MKKKEHTKPGKYHWMRRGILIALTAACIYTATYGDFDKWLETRIEKEVRANKTEKPEADHTVEAATTAASVAATVASTAVQQLTAEASDATPRE